MVVYKVLGPVKSIPAVDLLGSALTLVPTGHDSEVGGKFPLQAALKPPPGTSMVCIAAADTFVEVRPVRLLEEREVIRLAAGFEGDAPMEDDAELEGLFTL